LEEHGSYQASGPVRKGLKAWQARKDEYLARPPISSPVGDAPLWEGPTAAATDQRASE
jgi:hypothetical protein